MGVRAVGPRARPPSLEQQSRRLPPERASVGPLVEEPERRERFKIHWRRFSPLAVLLALFFGWLAVDQAIGISGFVLTRVGGTPGTFELEDCGHHPGGRRGADHYRCVATFTGADGTVREGVDVTVHSSPEDGHTSRTGHLRGDTAVVDGFDLVWSGIWSLFWLLVTAGGSIVFLWVAADEMGIKKNGDRATVPGPAASWEDFGPARDDLGDALGPGGRNRFGRWPVRFRRDRRQPSGGAGGQP